MYKDKKVLITGGASGIGRIMARKLLEQGATVIVWDISQSNINDTLHALSPFGTITANIVDISDSTSVETAAQEVLAKHKAIDILINSAGIVVGKLFCDSTVQDIERTMGINTNGAMFTVLAFLPTMIAQGSGKICNIASSASLVANPNMSIYAASKWAMFGWSDSLRLELRKSGVDVTTIMPYYINTGMFNGVHSRILPILKPENVASTILKAIRKGKKQQTIFGWFYHTLRILQGLLPLCVYDFILEKIFGIYSTMDHFVGRKQ